jgi:hypothetical protein
MRLFALAGLAFAASFAAAQDLKVTVNGDPVNFGAVGPQRVDGRVFVPLRGVMEKIGAFVGWDGKTRTVIAEKGNISLSLRLGDRNATVNGRTVVMDVPAQQIMGTTMVPLRFMGESLGADVKYDAATATIMISTTGETGGGNTGGGNTGGGNTGGGTTTTVAISGFTFDAGGGWLRLGQTAKFSLSGTPGGKAEVIVSGLSNPIPLNEGPSGTYTGTWTPNASQPVSIRNTSVLGRLTIGGKEQLIQAANSLSVDLVGPSLKNPNPAGGSVATTLTPDISVVFGDDGSGIDRSSVRMSVNGVDVTKETTITGDFAIYQPDKALKAGDNVVAVSVKDQAGNETKSSWTFKVESKITAKVTGFAHTGNKGVKAGDNLSFQLMTEAGAKIAISVGTVKNFALTEGPAGTYKGTYKVLPTDQFNNSVVVANVTLKDGNKFASQAPQRVNGVAAPVKLAVSSPSAGASVSSPLTVTGTHTANQKLLVRVEYATTMAGALRVTGTVTEVTVTANAQGQWTTEPISLSTIVSGSNTEYTIIVTALNAGGEKMGDPVSVKVKKG